MSKLMKMATVVVGVGAMLGFAGCGGDSPNKKAETVALAKAKMGVGGNPSIAFEVVSSQLNGDKCIVVVRGTEKKTKTVLAEDKIEVSHVNGEWKIVDPDANKSPRELSLERIKESANAFNEAGWEYKVVSEKINDQKAELTIEAIKNGHVEETMTYQYTKDREGIWRSACW